MTRGLCLLIVFILAGCGDPNLPRPAPDVEFTLLDGSRLKLAELRGKPVVVNFWSTDCVICQHELPYLVAMYEQLHPQGMQFIGPAMPYDRPDHVIEHVKGLSIPYPIALDIDGRVLNGFGDVPGTPTTYLIDTDGQIVVRQVGPVDIDALKAGVIAMLKPPNS